MQLDNQVIITLTTLRQFYATANTSFTVNVMTGTPEQLDPSINEAIGTFRRLRKDSPGEDNSFDITRSDSLVTLLNEQTSMLTIAAFVIAILTVFGSAIGLMNIMLVSVTERTREIGTRKALGASAGLIRRQFLIESLVIGQLGGLVGLVLGIVGGNVVAALVETDFIVPWFWMIISIILCLFVGVASGFYPARKASRLDPIDALRYE